jgi:hypothetical protein
MAISILLLSSVSCFCELVDPPPFKVEQVCGETIAPDSELSLTQVKGGRHVLTTQSDKDANFDFGVVSAGLYQLSVKWRAQDGSTWGPMQNRYPIQVMSSKKIMGCKRPLLVTEVSVPETGLSVRFRSESK